MRWLALAAVLLLAGCAAPGYTHTYRWTDAQAADEALFHGAAYQVGPDVLRWHDAPPHGVYFIQAEWTRDGASVRVVAEPVGTRTDDQNRLRPDAWRLRAEAERPPGTAHAAAHERLVGLLEAIDPAFEPSGWETSDDGGDEATAGWVALTGSGFDARGCLGDTPVEPPVQGWEGSDLFGLLGQGHAVTMADCTIQMRIDFAAPDVGPHAGLLLDVFGRAQLVLEGPRHAWERAHDLAARQGLELPQDAHHERRSNGGPD